MAEQLIPLRKRGGGGGKLVHKTVSIGSATSYNITSLCPKYKELTTANFAVSTQGYGSTRVAKKDFGYWFQTLTIESRAWHTAPGISSYNATNGIVYISQGKSGGKGTIQNNTISGELTLGITLHIVYIE